MFVVASPSVSTWRALHSEFGSPVDLPYLRFHLIGWRCDTLNISSSVADLTQDPGSLVRFFAILAVSSGSDLGIDTNIGIVDAYNSGFTFIIGGTTYQTSKCLYDDGTTNICGRGTRASEVRVDGEATALVIKDCWLEDRQDRTLEHDMVEKVRSAVGQAEFRRRFIDICGHRVTRNAVLDRVCEILKHDFNKKDGFYAVPIHWSCQPVEPKQPPCPRFRYQIVYREKGDSFYHIKSLQKAYLDLNDVTKGESIMRHLPSAERRLTALYSLHISKFIHGDVRPGNIFSFEEGAKLSDLEFARERDVEKLSEFTLESLDSPSHETVEHLVVRSDGSIPSIHSSTTREHDLSWRQKLRQRFTCFSRPTTTTTAWQQMTHSRS